MNTLMKIIGKWRYKHIKEFVESRIDLYEGLANNMVRHKDTNAIAHELYECHMSEKKAMEDMLYFINYMESH